MARFVFSFDASLEPQLVVQKRGRPRRKPLLLTTLCWTKPVLVWFGLVWWAFRLTRVYSPH
jgi:hypothetical protein